MSQRMDRDRNRKTVLFMIFAAIMGYGTAKLLHELSYVEIECAEITDTPSDMIEQLDIPGE